MKTFLSNVERVIQKFAQKFALIARNLSESQKLLFTPNSFKNFSAVRVKTK